MDTPVSLLERLRLPADGEAWTRFVALYTPLLYSWAHRAGLREPDAADLVQDVFVLLLRKLPGFTYDPARSFRSWLRTVTLNRWRERQRRLQLPREGDNAVLDDVAEREPVEAFWEAEYRQHLVREAFELVKPHFQPASWTACWQQVVEGKSTAEVAAALHLTPGAVRAAKFRVLTRLRQELAGLLE